MATTPCRPFAGGSRCRRLSPGGVYRYAYYLLEAVADPDDPEHENALDWLGANFDPEALDLDRINQRLERASRS